MSKFIEKSSIHLYDMLGKIVVKQKLAKETIQEIKFNKDISAGYYLLQIIADKVIYEKLILIEESKLK